MDYNVIGICVFGILVLTMLLITGNISLSGDLIALIVYNLIVGLVLVGCLTIIVHQIYNHYRHRESLTNPVEDHEPTEEDRLVDRIV